MTSATKKFLEFNGHELYFTLVEGEWWVALKPICQAIGVDWEAQRKSLKRHPFLSQLPSEQTVVAGDNRLRKMICLPEILVYGWLLQIRSDNEDLIQYQWECYQILFNHFSGTITQRKKIVKDNFKTKSEIQDLERELRRDDKYLQLIKLKNKQRRNKRKLNNLDKRFIDSSPSFFD